MKIKNEAEKYAHKAFLKRNKSNPMSIHDLCFSVTDIKAAFNAGRESVVENIPDLEWTETTYNLEDYFLSHNNGWSYGIFFRNGAFKVHCNSNFIGRFLSLTAAKQAANEDYKKRIKQALEL